MPQSKREHFWVSRGHGVEAPVCRVTHGAGGPVEEHINTYRGSVRDGIGGAQGSCSGQSCPAAPMAERFLCAFREMVTSKSEAATQGFPILALFGVFCPSGVVYNQHAGLMNTSKLYWVCWINLPVKQKEAADGLESRQSWCSHGIQLSQDVGTGCCLKGCMYEVLSEEPRHCWPCSFLSRPFVMQSSD